MTGHPSCWLPLGKLLVDDIGGKRGYPYLNTTARCFKSTTVSMICIYIYINVLNRWYCINRHGSCVALIQSEFQTINKQFPTALFSPLQTPSPPFRTAPSLRPAARKASRLGPSWGSATDPDPVRTLSKERVV